jgi:hypothetical protein
MLAFGVLHDIWEEVITVWFYVLIWNVLGATQGNKQTW